jgi:hypothetical protein
MLHCTGEGHEIPAPNPGEVMYLYAVLPKVTNTGLIT